MSNLQSTSTQYVRVENGIAFAYRRLGPVYSQVTRFLLHIYFRANMDFWDPLLINNLAQHRPVIIFDNASIGRSSGEIPTTFQGWAEDTIAFVRALGLEQIDLLGFSMGGAAVQQIALSAPDLIRKLFIASTSTSEPSAASDTSGIVWPRANPPPEPLAALATAETPVEVAASLQAKLMQKKYWERVHERNVAGEPNVHSFNDVETSKRQSASFGDWMTPNPRKAFDRLGELQMPAMVVNGDRDVLIATSRSWEMHAKIPNSQLIVYPRAGYGFIWQYAELFTDDIRQFLDGGDFKENLAKL